MPPRISPHRLTQHTSHQCFRTRPQAIPPSTTTNHRPQTCQFHTTPRNNTRLRRNMYAWLNGPGKVFRDPKPGSTNYLAAYDRQGRLIRMNSGEEQRRRLADPELDEDEDVIQAREAEAGVSQEDVLRRADLRVKKRLEREELDARGGVPKERAADLRPYPLNQQFRSQPVLSQELREKIFEMIVEQGFDLKSVSAAFGVDIRRVAAVVRLGSVEREWMKEGKPLAKPYNNAVLSMLPQTPYRPELRSPPAHESINDLPVHPYTRQQIFLPTSESRHFTREDAAKVFHHSLLPADQRIPHPELVQIQKWELEGHDRETRQRMVRERDTKEREEREEKERWAREWERRTQVVVKGRRWDFKFQRFNAEKVGRDGRGRDAVGARYGMPHEDRKRGMVKIPTKVE